MKKVFVFLGPPGVGKGTQASLLSERLHLPHISIGNIFRDNVKHKTVLGLKAEKFVNEGLLAPNELTMELVGARLAQKDCVNGYILDGFPRALEQDESLCKMGVKITSVLYFNAPRDILIDRILNRNDNRSDATIETINKRLDVYETETCLLIPHYKDKNILHEFDASEAVDEIFSHVIETI